MLPILACNRFKGRHTADKIYQEYETVVLDFEIANIVKHVKTDTAKNMAKAFTLPNYEQEGEDEESETEDVICDSEDGEDCLSQHDSVLMCFQ